MKFDSFRLVSATDFSREMIPGQKALELDAAGYCWKASVTIASSPTTTASHERMIEVLEELVALTKQDATRRKEAT